MKSESKKEIAKTNQGEKARSDSAAMRRVKLIQAQESGREDETERPIYEPESDHQHWLRWRAGRLGNAVRQPRTLDDAMKTPAYLLRGQDDLGILGESEKPGYTAEGRADRQTDVDLPPENMDEAARIEAAAELLYSVYPREAVRKALEDLAANAAHETTSRSATAQPRPHATMETPPLSSSKVQAVFGNIPPEFQTKRHSKSIIPEDAIHDPEVVQTAKDIVNANRRTKIETLEPKARETLRIARRIVRANEGLSLT